MKKSIFKTSLLVGIVVCLSGTISFNVFANKDAPNTLTKKEKKQGWELLFDGKTFKTWNGYNVENAPDCWIIENGMMKMTTKGGQESQDVIIGKTYKKFELKFEFVLTKGANSGVLFQVKEDPKYKFPYQTGPEYQIIYNENWPDKLEDWQIYGANYAMYPPKVKSYRPVGEWNQAALIVIENEVTQYLNGNEVVKCTKYSDECKKLWNSGKWADFPDYGKFDESHISFQNHGTNVSYRNIKLKEL